MIPNDSPIETKFRTCHLCEAMCGLQIEVQGNQVLSIKGHEADIYSKGHICPKGVALKELHEDPDRLKRPMKRTANGWEEISWEAAFDTVEKEMKRIRKKYGNDAIGTYTGNPTVHNTGTALTLYDTVNAIDTKNRFASHSMDSVPHFLVNQLMFGNAVLAPITDIERVEYMLIFGANPLASNGSFMSVPDFRGKMRAVQTKGGKVVVIDPRKSETAQKASEHYFIQPEADVLLLLAIVHELFRREAVVETRVLKFTDGLTALQEIVKDYAPSKVSDATGLSEKDILHIVDDLLSFDHSVVYGRMGISVQTYGSLCSWLINCINILTGNLDEVGGAMFTEPAIDYVKLMAHESQIHRYASRVNGYKEIIGEFPTAAMADEILTPGKGQIRALLTIAGNPARSAPNSTLVEKALKDLEFMVAVDMYINETTQHADIILPPAVGLETMHYSFVLHIVATKNTTKFSPAPLTITKEQRYDWQIMGELQRRLFTGNIFQRIKNYGLSKIHPKTKLDLALKTGAYGKWGGRFLKKDGLSLKTLLEQKEGVHISNLRPVFPERLMTANKRITLVPDLFKEEINKAKSLLEAKPIGKYPFKLIGRRHLRSNNSWMHNLPVLEGGSRRCTALLHPQDAESLSAANGSLLKVYSEFGSVEIPLEITEDIIPGTVSIPHGWGHQGEGIELAEAQKNAGVNCNILMDHSRLDAPSYNAAFSGQPVAVEKLL